MAFLGKASVGRGEGKANIPVKVSCSKNGRLGVVFRNGLIPEGTPVDVMVGTGEDHGKLMVVFTGNDLQPVKSLGHKGQSTSWSGIRTKATKGLPEMKRRPCVILEKADTYILIDMQLGDASVVEEGEGAEVEEVTEVVEEAPAIEEAAGVSVELGL